MGKTSLFDDEEPVRVEPVLHVNKEFAKRFEHNEKRAELHRLKEKYPEKAARLEAKLLGAAAAAGRKAAKEEDAEDSSDDEEEDDGYIPAKTEAQLLETLLKIRAKDPSVYSKEAKFYSSDEEEEEEEGEEEESGAGAGAGGKQQQKPLYLKDVLYRQAMEGAGAGAGSSDSEGDGAGARVKREADAGPRTYNQEQRELKQAFLKAFEEEAGVQVKQEQEEEQEEGGAFGGVLKKRKGRAAADAEEEEGGAGGADGAGGRESTDARVQALLDSYFGPGDGDELPESDRFLKQYILNKGWVERGDGEEDDEGAWDFNEADQEDEQYLEQAEQYEHAYNFRFEEPGAAEIVTYPRKLEGVVRKEDDRRKRKRAEKAERKREEESRRQAELKRLKNLKKQEIEEKLQEIQAVAGRAAPDQSLLDRLMAGDFDPEEYDKQMAAAFGDDYYEGAVEEEEDLADAEFEKELAAMAAGGGSDDDEEGEGGAAKGFEALRRKLGGGTAGGTGGEGEGEEASDDDEEEDEEGEGEAAPKSKEQLARERAEVQRLLEEYYKLDYEDYVGGVATRFRYKEVPRENFGLSLEDVLSLTDKELNQIVGLKKLAPYREDGGRRFRPNYGALNAARAARAQEGAPGVNKQRKQEWWAKKGGGRGEWKKKKGQGDGEEFFEREGEAEEAAEGGRGGEQQHEQEQGTEGRKKEREGKKQRREQQGKREREGGGKGAAEGRQGEARVKKEGGEARVKKEEEGATRVKTEKERRLESYAQPSLKRGKAQAPGEGAQAGGGKKKRKRQEGGAGGGKLPKGEQGDQQAQHDGPALTKAQKKNLWRAKKRAEKRGGAGDAGAAAAP